MKTKSGLFLTVIISASLAAPLGALAAPVTVQLDEGNFVNTNGVLLEEANNIGINALGFDPATLQIHSTNETATGFIIGDIHAEWIGLTPFAPGVAQTFNFNIFDLAIEGGLLSDTLSITLTGQTPSTSDVNNMSMDFHFRSDSLTGNPALTPLAGGIAITENGFFQSVNAFLPSQFVGDVNNPLSVSFRSDVVPEPGAWQLGLLSLVSLPFLRRLCVKH